MKDKRTIAAPAASPIDRRDIQAVCPVSPMQAGLLFHSMFRREAGDAAYHQQAVLVLTGSVDAERLEASWQQVVSRHSSLRTAFVWQQKDRPPLQVILRPEAVKAPWQVLDWRGMSVDERSAKLRGFLKADHQTPYALGRAPLLRLALARLDGEEWFFIFSHHHLIMDGWSSTLVLKQVVQEYSKLGQGKGGLVDLPSKGAAERAARARDSEFQKALVALRAAEAPGAELHFRELFGDNFQATALPGERAGNAVSGLQTDANPAVLHVELTSRLPAELSQQLVHLARRRRITLNTLLQGLWAVALGRSVGATEVTFGVVVSGRSERLAGAEQHVGLLINSLPVRVDLEPTQTGEELLNDLQRQNLTLLRSQLTSLKEIQGWSGASPVFETLFVFDNFPRVDASTLQPDPGRRSELGARRLNELEISALGEQAAERNHYALTLVAVPEDEILLALSHDTSRVSDVAAKGLMGGLRHLCEQVVQEEKLQRPIGDWELRTEEPVEPFVAPTNADGEGAGLLGRIALHARLRPTHTALVGDRNWTWAELWQTVSRVGQSLSERGLRREDRVALLLPRSDDWVIAALAVLWAGGAYVPLDPEGPSSRTERSVRDSGARWIFVEGCRGTKLELGECKPTTLATLLQGTGSQTGAPSPGHPEQLAYVIYTSGSSGVPKGVGSTLRNVSSYSRAICERLELNPEGRLGWVSSATADLGNTCVLGALWSGATLVVVRPEIANDADVLGALLREQKVDTLKIAPSQWLGLRAASVRPQDMVPARALVFGGEALTPSCVRQVRELSPTVELFNHYGPTETTVGIAVYKLGDRDSEGNASLPFGTALGSHVRLQLLDHRERAQPVGLPGQLWASGPALARGYLGRPSLTAERFVPDPSSQGVGQRRYATGDRVLEGASGYRFLGRLDEQLKINGFRVESGEIEAALLGCSQISEAVVHCSEHDTATGQGPRLIASVVVSQGQVLDEGVVRTELGSLLPSALVPSQIVEHAKLPLLASGKIDRGALKGASVVSGGASGPEKPRAGEAETAVEELLLEIWREVLRRPQLGRVDDFFQSGGDSILSLQIVARTRRAGYRMTPKQLFDSPSVAALAGQLRPIDTEAVSPKKSVGAISTALTPIQRWFFDLDLPKPEHFNQALWLPLEQELNEAQLRRALETCLERHPGLRSNFSSKKNGVARQHWSSDTSSRVPLRWVQLPSEADAQARWVESEARALQLGLDLGGGPLLRAGYFALPERPAGKASTKGYLLLVAHHAVVDAVSWQVLLEELFACCGGEPLPPAPLQSQGWSAALEQYARSPEVTGAARLFFETQEEFGPLKPSLNEGTSRLQRDQCVLKARLGSEISLTLQDDLPRMFGVTISDVVLAGLCDVLCEWSGRAGISVELEGHGRQVLPGAPSSVDVSRSVGWFTARYPVSIARNNGQGRLLQLLGTKDQLRAVPDQGRPYGVLCTYDPSFEAKRAPEVAFNYLGQTHLALGAVPIASPEGDLSSPRHRGQERDPDGVRAQRFSLVAQMTAQGLELQWLYGERHDSQVRVQGLLDRLVESIHEFAKVVSAHPDGAFSVADFPLSGLSLEQIRTLDLHRSEVEQVWALTPLQRGLLVEGLKRRGAYEYVLDVAVDNLNDRALHLAFEGLMKRHPLLRTRVCWSTPEGDLEAPVGIVLRPEAAALPLVSVLSEWPLASQGAGFDWHVELEQLRDRGLDLAVEFPWKVRILRDNEGNGRIAWLRHHLVADGWSTGLLLAELQSRYTAECEGREFVEEQYSAAYPDYCRWLQRQPLEAGIEYFAGKLATVSGPTPLPPRRGGRPAERADAAECRQLLGASESQRIGKWAAAHGVTLNTVLQGAWSLLLSRHCGRERVCFGVTVSGRPPEVPGIERAVGVFINTLPLVVALPADHEVGAWLRSVQSDNAAMRQFEHVPLYEIGVGNKRAGALITSALVFENYPVTRDAVENGALRIQALKRHEGAHYTLMLVVNPGEELGLALHYDRSAYDASRANELLLQLSALLSAMCQEEARLGQLHLSGGHCPTRGDLLKLSERESPRFVSETLTESLEKVVRRYAERVAVSWQGPAGSTVEYSYRELWQRAGNLARYLRGCGVGPEVPVGLCLHRSGEQLVALLGVLRAGGYYVPLDPEQPAARRREMLERLGVEQVLEEGFYAAKVAGLEHSESARAAREIASEACADNLAYVIHTSGSTGEPKAVGVCHAQVQSLFASCREKFSFDCEDVWSYFHSCAFDFSVWEIWGALLNGGRVVVVPQEARRDTRSFAKLLARERVTMLSQTPSAFYALSEELLRSSNGSPLLPALRTVVFGGESLDVARLHDWQQAFGNQGPSLVNMYGITETTVHVTWTDLTQAAVAEANEAGSPVGRALRHGPVEVLDPWGHRVPVEAEGELFVAGSGVARGYLGQPGLTASRFVPDPHGAPGARAYRTGDLGQWQADLSLLHRGRMDDQVQLRGHRIEPGEVRACLAEHSLVLRAEVLVVRPQRETASLVAYVRCDDGIARNAVTDRLSQYLAERLPHYMLPSKIYLVEEFPLNSNGKLNRAELLVQHEPDPEGRAPTTEQERELAELWEELLEVKEVQLDDDFFRLGGHSLLAVRLMTRVRARFGAAVSLAEFFKTPTLEAMAQQLGAGKKGSKATEVDRLAALFEQELFEEAVDGEGSEE